MLTVMGCWGQRTHGPAAGEVRRNKRAQLGADCMSDEDGGTEVESRLTCGGFGTQRDTAAVHVLFVRNANLFFLR